MPIFTNFTHNYPEDPARYYGFENFEHLFPNINLYFGAELPQEITQYTTNKKILFATEEQIDDLNPDYNVANIPTYEEYVNEVLSISPLCNKRDKPKRQYVFQPFNEKFEPEDKTKIWDVIYTGNCHVGHALDIANVICDFKLHRLVSYRYAKATNLNTLYIEKLQLIANSKINIIHNIVTPNIPQLKTRPFEAAFCKSLMICRYDKFKTIEKWFTPDEDFMYYNTESELKDIIQKTLDDYNQYQFMIENAYNKAKKEYTTEQFVKKYLMHENIICD
jgi:hypothetical protein